jgi:hypothetical protein
LEVEAFHEPERLLTLSFSSGPKGGEIKGMRAFGNGFCESGRKAKGQPTEYLPAAATRRAMGGRG